LFEMLEKNRRFRVAMVAACPFPYPRGTPVRIFRMAEFLSKRGHEVHVITYHLGQELDHLPFTLHRVKQVKSYRKHSPGPTYQKLLVMDSLLTAKLFVVLKRHAIDLIHAHHYEGLIASALVRTMTKHPLVYDAHTLLASELPFYSLYMSRHFKHKFGQLLDNWLPRLADHVISVTNDIRSKLINNSRLSRDKVTVVANGVEHKHFQSAHRFPYSTRQTGERLIYTGNLSAFQGIDLMFHAFK